MKKYYRELTKLILKTAAKGAFVVTLSGFAGPNAPKLISQFAKYEIKYLRFALRRLHRLKMIELREDHERQLIAKLTAKGEVVLKREEIEKLKIAKPVKWDGLWRIVAFDIPTEKKISRDYFRNHLYSLGFYQIQKSVFVYPYPCEREIQELCEFYEIERTVLLMLATYLGGQEVAVRRFFRIGRRPAIKNIKKEENF